MMAKLTEQQQTPTDWVVEQATNELRVSDPFQEAIKARNIMSAAEIFSQIRKEPSTFLNVPDFYRALQIAEQFLTSNGWSDEDIATFNQMARELEESTSEDDTEDYRPVGVDNRDYQ